MLRKLLNETEKQAIESYINAYAFKRETTHLECSVDELLYYWNEAKSQYLYSLLGNNFIISKDIYVEMGIEELANIVEDELMSYCCNDPWSEFINEYFVLTSNFDSFVRNKLNNLLSPRALAENIYRGCTFEVPTPDGKEIKIQTGCKVTRMLNKIAEAYELDGWEEFRLRHSLVLNQKKLSGKLHLSIHPLDYMTMSDNANDWTSCMSWIEDGCYRQGTVEMMNSPMVVVAYLTGHNEMELPNGLQWNSKKWRELYIVNPDIISNIKAYPYQNENLTKETIEWLKELADAINFAEYTDEAYAWDTDAVEQKDTDYFNNNGIRIRTETNYMYNDFENTCQGHLSYLRRDLTGMLRFNYSGEPQCMCCGHTSDNFDNEGVLACEDCEDVFRCSECDCVVSDGERFEVDGECLCYSCYDEYTFEDCVTEEIHLTRDMERIHVVKSICETPIGERAYNEGKNYLDLKVIMEEFRVNNFPDNWEQNAAKVLSNTGHFHVSTATWDRIYYIYLDELTDYAIRALGYSDLDEIIEEYNISRKLLDSSYKLVDAFALCGV